MISTLKGFLKFFTVTLSSIFCVSACTSLEPPRLSYQGGPIISVVVYIEDTFTKDEKVNIVKGMDMWVRATSGAVIWHLAEYDANNPPRPPMGYDDGIEERLVMFRKASTDDEWVKNWDKKSGYMLWGLCHGNSLKEMTWLWLVTDRLYNPTIQSIVAAHEFGHSIGIDHIKDKMSVMSQFVVPTVHCLTESDLSAFCQKHGCSDENIVRSICI